MDKGKFDLLLPLLLGLEDPKNTSMNSYALVFEGDHTPIVVRSAACYSYLGYEELNRTLDANGELSHIVSAVKRHLVPKNLQDNGAAEQYVNWVVQKSMWADAFDGAFYGLVSHRSPYQIGLVGKASTPANVLVGALEVARAVTYHPQTVEGWKTLVDLGFSPDFALLAGYWVRSITKEKFNLMSPGLHSHCALDPAMWKETELRNFFRRNITYKTQLFKKNTQYHGIFDMFSGADRSLNGSFDLLEGFNSRPTARFSGSARPRVTLAKNSDDLVSFLREKEKEFLSV